MDELDKDKDPPEMSDKDAQSCETSSSEAIKDHLDVGEEVTDKNSDNSGNLSVHNSEEAVNNFDVKASNDNSTSSASAVDSFQTDGVTSKENTSEESMSVGEMRDASTINCSNSQCVDREESSSESLTVSDSISSDIIGQNGTEFHTANDLTEESQRPEKITEPSVVSCDTKSTVCAKEETCSTPLSDISNHIEDTMPSNLQNPATDLELKNCVPTQCNSDSENKVVSSLQTESHSPLNHTDSSSSTEFSSQSLNSLNDNDSLLSELEQELSPNPTEEFTSIPPNGLKKTITADLQFKLLAAQNSLLSHIQECQALKSEKESLSKTLQQAEEKCKNLEQSLEEAESSRVTSEDVYSAQTSQLEKTVAEQQKEIKELSSKLTSHDTAAKRAITALQAELKHRVDAAVKQYEDCRKEKDDMVMKFALAEQKNIERAEKVSKMEAHVREVAREREAMMTKFRQVKSEKAKLTEMCDAKGADVNAAKKEIERQKDLVETQEVKVRWAQNKLKVEVESHKETKVRLEDLQRKFKEAREECEQIRRDCQAIVKTYQESEEIKSNSLDQKLKETEGQLLAQQQERSDQRDLVEVTKRELEQLKHQLKEVVTELAKSKDQVQCLDAERICLEQSVEKCEATIHAQKSELSEKEDKLSKFKELSKTLFKTQEDLSKYKQNCEELEQANKDLTADIEACSKREGEHLEFSRKISDKNTQLQSENTLLNSKVVRLSSELEKAFEDNESLQSNLVKLEGRFKDESMRRESDTQTLSEQLELKSKAVEELTVQLEDERDSVRTLKRKHQANIKDLTRQLHQVKKRLEGMESPKGDSASAGSMGSRTSSSNSIDTVGRGSSQEPQIPGPPSQDDNSPIVEYVEVDKQMMIEKIVKLQKSHARKNEKLEFMEDHINQLLAEVQKKSKIIQSYVVREESGILASEASDIHKNEQRRQEVKAALSKKGGIMASVFSQHSQDGTMNLDLSLQITRKLQAVLEDTLLKNITLKENIDTLGQEIARLSQQNRQLELSLRKL